METINPLVFTNKYGDMILPALPSEVEYYASVYSGHKSLFSISLSSDFWWIFRQTRRDVEGITGVFCQDGATQYGGKSAEKTAEWRC